MSESERLAVQAECARDVCAECGGRATAWHPEVSGPNDAGNYTHGHRARPATRKLCGASSIWARIRYEFEARRREASAALVDTEPCVRGLQIERDSSGAARRLLGGS